MPTPFGTGFGLDPNREYESSMAMSGPDFVPHETKRLLPHANRWNADRREPDPVRLTRTVFTIETDDTDVVRNPDFRSRSEDIQDSQGVGVSSTDDGNTRAGNALANELMCDRPSPGEIRCGSDLGEFESKAFGRGGQSTLGLD